MDVRSFDRWLLGISRRSIDSLLNEENVVKKNSSSDDDDPDEAPSDGNKDDDQADDPAPPDNRGGPQQAKAAIRDVPAPSEDALTLAMVIDKLNAVRSGKSLRDDDVRKRLGEYFVDLNTTERLALFAFLEGLAEIVAADVPGEHARAPNDPDINVEMNREDTDIEDTTDADKAPHVHVKKGGPSITGGRRQGVVTTNASSSSNEDDGPVLVVRR